MKAALFIKPNPKALEVEGELMKELFAHGFEIDNENPDVVFFAGGDGTFLRAINKYIKRVNDIKFAGINYGTLGFFYDYEKEDIHELVESIANGTDYSIGHRLLKGRAICDDQESVFYALNEIRVENPFSTLISEVYINDELLENFHGTGLLISSSVGSSAYNKSSGGALMHSDLELLQLTEIDAIQNNAYRSLGSSLIVSETSKITLKGDFRKSIVGYDCIIKDDATVINQLTVSLSHKRVHLVYKNGHSYINMLRKSFID